MCGTVPYLCMVINQQAMFTTYTPDTFFTKTAANWQRVCFNPEAGRPADFKSGSGSAYWYTAEGVYRVSDHWGHVASCYWVLDGEPSKFNEARVGFCPWDAFAESRSAIWADMTNATVEGMLDWAQTYNRHITSVWVNAAKVLFNF